MQVSDKRVSRNHGILDVEDNKLYLTPVSIDDISKTLSYRNIMKLNKIKLYSLTVPDEIIDLSDKV